MVTACSFVAALSDGTVSWDDAWGAWFSWSALYFWPAVFAGLLVLTVAKALVRARRYRAVDVLSESERSALRERVTAIEARSDGELAVVVVERADAHPDAPWKAACAVAVLGTVLCGHWLPYSHPVWLCATQAVFGGLGYGLARGLADLRRSFVRERRASEVAEEQALQEFHRLALARSPERSGVLLFVSLFEQRVVVLADEVAHRAAGEGAWVAVDEAVLSGLRAASLRLGLERGIDAAGEVLVTTLPSTGDGPNRHRDDIDVRRS
jgi:putative membrane protein